MTQTPSSPAGSQQQQPPPAEPFPQAADRRVLVGAMIGAASLLFLVTLGLLYLRWATMREPSCVLIVEAPSDLRGAVVTVSGLGIDEPHRVVIGEGERFAIPFFLDFGNYTVRVTLNEKPVLETEVSLTHQARGLRLDLTKLPPLPSTQAASPTTAPGPALRDDGRFVIPPRTPTLTPPPFDGGSGYAP